MLVTRGQLHPDPAARVPEAGSDLQEFEPQGIDLGRFQFRALTVPTQQPEQARGGARWPRPAAGWSRTIKG